MKAEERARLVVDGWTKYEAGKRLDFKDLRGLRERVTRVIFNARHEAMAECLEEASDTLQGVSSFDRVARAVAGGIMDRIRALIAKEE